MLRSLTSGVWVSTPEHFIPDPGHTVCITGHRAKSIEPYKGDPSLRAVTVRGVQFLLFRYIDMAYEAGFTSFIDGLSTGTDLWAAQYITMKKNAGRDMKLIGAMPYLRHAERFPAAELRTLREVESSCDCIVCTNSDPDIVYSKKGEGRDLYRTRNYFMADSSSAAIAYYNPSEYRSGTHQTVSYLRSSGKTVIQFSNEDIYRIMDEVGTDTEAIRHRIAAVPNLFTSR